MDAIVAATGFVVLLLDWMALVVIAVGSIEAFGRAVVMLFKRGPVAAADRRGIWMQYARWLVAALTFQLAADIAATAIAPSWDEVGKLAAIAAVRTLLDYFLGRDMDEVRDRDRLRAETGEPKP